MILYTLILTLPFLMLYLPPPSAPTLPLATLPPFPRATLKPLPTLPRPTVKPLPRLTVSPPRPVGMPCGGWLFDPATGAERTALRALETRPGLTFGLPLPRCDRRASALSAVPYKPQPKPATLPLPRCPRTGRFLPRKDK
jgi:hypothetical protein